MSDREFSEVLVREGIRGGAAVAVAPATYPMGDTATGTLVQIQTIKSDLRLGNLDAVIRSAQTVSGKSAIRGERELTSLVRQSIMATRRGLLTEAGNLLARAESVAEATR